jgi:23S rRNA pseudouridine2457 synthase
MGHHRYLLFNKPFNVLSQFTDQSTSEQVSRVQNPDSQSPRDRRLLKDYIPIPNVYPVGRLDQDSEGLMLLTSDGPLQHRLSDPKFEHPRTYCVQVEHIPTVEALDRLRQGGIPIQNYRTRPTQVQHLKIDPKFPDRDPPIRQRKTIPTAWIEIILTEGRNRQVRRMTAAVGFPTLRLIRTAIGKLQLTDLAPGEWRDLTPEELQFLRI